MVKLVGTIVIATTTSLNGLASQDGWISDVQVCFRTGLAKIDSPLSCQVSSHGAWLAEMPSQRKMMAASAEKSTSLAVVCRPYAAFVTFSVPRPQH